MQKKAVVQILRAPAGGIRKHVFDIIDSLASHENIEQVFITNTKDSDRALPTHKNVTVYHLPIEDQPGFGDLKNILSIYKILKKYNVCVLHGHGAKGGIYARVLSLFFKATSIYTPHGGSLHRVFGTLKNKLYSLIELGLVPLTNVFLFESHYSYNEFSRNVCALKKKAIVNYNGLEIPQLHKTSLYQAHSKLHFASFGLLRHLKGHDIFIVTCSMLAKEKIPFEYSIYGSGEEKEKLLALIKKYHLEEHIHILDYSGIVIEEMLRFDFIVHPSRFESFGYVPAEAMSVRVPVITSSVGGLKEVVDPECGYVSLDNSAQSYFEMIKKIYEGDPELPAKIESGFLRVKTKFSKVQMLAKIEEIYFS